MNIIILPLYGIGDVLMTTPALKILKEQMRDSRVTCLCIFQNTYDVLKNNPDIDSLVLFTSNVTKDLRTLRSLYSLRGRFDCSINFYPSNRTQYNMLAYLIGAKKRIGHRYLHRDMLELNFLKNHTVIESMKLHNVEENVRLLEFLGLKSDNIPPMKIYLTLEEVNKGKEYIRSSSRRKIGVHAGTSVFKAHAGKRWPLDNFAELIDHLDDCDFYLFGGPDDKNVNETIVRNLRGSGTVFKIEGLPIRIAASVIKNMDLFISNDSGLMHLAAAVGVPVVAIFGPTNPGSLRPWGIRHKVIRTDLPCPPCFYYSPNPLECKSEDKFRCLKDLPPDTVYAAVCELLNQQGETSG